jgi:hypothetical protein
VHLVEPSLRVEGEEAFLGFHNRGSDLLGQSVGMPEALRRDLNLVGHLHVILEAKPLALGCLPA